jgi:hypothetical protein
MPYPHGVMRGLVLVCFVAFAAAAGCGGDGEGSVDRFGLRGRVSDARSGKAIEGATVIFVSDALDVTDARSGDGGRYSMTAVVAAGVEFGTIRAERDGYRPSPERSVYFDGTERTVDLELERIESDSAGEDEE